MATTGRLGSIYAQLGNVELGADVDGHLLTLQAALAITASHDVTLAGAIGETKSRSVPTAVAVHRPPARTVPVHVALSRTGSRSIPAAVALRRTYARPVPAAVALRRTGQRLVPVAVAVSRPPEPALAAPRRQGLLPHLLEAFTPLYDREPAAVPMLTLTPIPDSPGMPWRVSGSLFEIVALGTVTPATPDAVTRAGAPGRTDGYYRDVPLQTGSSPAQGTIAGGTGLPPCTRDLRRFTLGDLATELTAVGYACTAAPAYAGLAATVLIDGSGDITRDPDIPGYTSLLWRLLRGLALGGEQVLDDVDLAAAQLDLRFAAGRWLDWWGLLYGLPREPVEGDDGYRARIAWSVLRPRSNNRALEAILAPVTGLALHVLDEVPVGVATGNGDDARAIDRTWSPDQAVPGTYFDGYPPRFLVATPPGTGPGDAARLARLVAKLRPAGVGWRVADYAVVERALTLQASLDA